MHNNWLSSTKWTALKPYKWHYTDGASSSPVFIGVLCAKKKQPWIWNHEFEREQVGVLEKREKANYIIMLKSQNTFLKI